MYIYIVKRGDIYESEENDIAFNNSQDAINYISEKVGKNIPSHFIEDAHFIDNNTYYCIDKIELIK